MANPHNILENTFWTRVVRDGWSEEKAMETPRLREEKRTFIADMFKDHENPHNLTKGAIHQRMRKGMSFEKVISHTMPW